MSELPELLIDGPDDAPVTIALAHGAGAAMDSAFMQAFAEGLAERGLRCVRFEFPYMAQRREDGKKRPPNRAP
ncbi:alpha/beta family hydrolase, partial [Pseudomonadota bacterium]